MKAKCLSKHHVKATKLEKSENISEGQLLLKVRVPWAFLNKTVLGLDLKTINEHCCLSDICWNTIPYTGETCDKVPIIMRTLKNY